MRIGLIVEQFDPQRGGLEQWTWQFASELLRLGHEVHVVARQFADCVRKLPVVCHQVDPGGGRIAFAEALENRLRKLPLDITHDMGFGWYFDVFQPHGGSWDSVTQRKQLIHPRWLRTIKRRVDPLLSRTRQYQRVTAAQYADPNCRYIAISKTVATDFQQYHGLASDQISLVYNGVDVRTYSPERCHPVRRMHRERLGISDEELTLLIAAHNFRLKGVPLLLRTVSRLASNGVFMRLIVVGGKRLAWWRKWANRLGIQEQVTFTGAVADLMPYYAAADVYAHPTLYDPCSLVLLEAAACGLPIITTTKYNGFSELVKHGDEAILLSSSNDVSEFANGLQLLQCPSRRAEMGADARAMAQGRPFERNVREILDIYRDILRNRRSIA